MGKAIVYAVMGLITIGLMIGAGLGIKFLLVLFLGRKKKEKNVHEPLAHTSGCRCSLCSGPGAHGVHKHY